MHLHDFLSYNNNCIWLLVLRTVFFLIVFTFTFEIYIIFLLYIKNLIYINLIPKKVFFFFPKKDYLFIYIIIYK